MLALPWWAWIIVAGVLGLAELHIPGSYLVWLALGAVVTGLVDAAAAGLSIESQIGIFAVASALSCAGGYFIYHGVGRFHRADPLLNERNRSMLRQRGIVCEAIRNGEGKVRLGDGVWLAAGPDMPEGTPVVVDGVHGTKLHVNALAARKDAEAGS
jgi:inner membrane protein